MVLAVVTILRLSVGGGIWMREWTSWTRVGSQLVDLPSVQCTYEFSGVRDPCRPSLTHQFASLLLLGFPYSLVPPLSPVSVGGP